MRSDEQSVLEPVLLAVLGALVAVSVVVWAGGWLATAATGGRLGPGLSQAPSAAVGYVQDPADPAGAWGDQQVPSGWVLYPVTAAVAAVTLVAGVVLVQGVRVRRSGFERRTRLGSSPEARLARPGDLAPLSARLPLHGRFLLGRVGRRVLATEWRARPGVRVPRRARGRVNDRGAVAVIGPSRQGKSVAIIAGVLEWDGPAVIMSVKDDLMAPTLPARRRLGECAVFDPTRFLADSYAERAAAEDPVPGWDERLLVGWSPLAHVATFDEALAAARAVCDAAPKGNVEGADFWMDQAEMLLAALFWVAGNTPGAGMGAVVRWVLTKDRPDEDCDGEVQGLLYRFRLLDPDGERARQSQRVEEVLQGFWGDEERTLSSVYSTARTVIRPWLGEAAVAASDGPAVSLAWLCSGANTLFLSAPPQDQRRLGPVFGGCVNDLVEQAFRYAAAHGPIDPPLLVVLDEAGNMPLRRLPEFVSTVAGLGIQLVTAWQSIAQIKEGYRASADTVLTNHLTKVFFGAQSDTDALDYVAKLVGDEEVATASSTTDLYALRRGSTQDSSQRMTLAPANVTRQMPKFTALLIHGALPPAHITAVRYFAERSYRDRLRWDAADGDAGLPRSLRPAPTAPARPVEAIHPLVDAVRLLPDADGLARAQGQAPVDDEPFAGRAPRVSAQPPVGRPGLESLLPSRWEEP